MYADVVGVDAFNLYNWAELCPRYTDLQKHARCSSFTPTNLQVISNKILELGLIYIKIPTRRGWEGGGRRSL